MDQKPQDKTLLQTQNQQNKLQGYRTVDPKLLESNRMDLYSINNKQSKLNSLNECDQVTLNLLEEKITEIKLKTAEKDKNLKELSDKMEESLLLKANIEKEIQSNSVNKSQEMDKVHQAEVELQNLNAMDAQKQQSILDIKTENTQHQRHLERERRLYMEMKNGHIKKIKELDEVIQTATSDITIYKKDIEKAKKLIEEYKRKEAAKSDFNVKMRHDLDNMTDQFNEKRSQQYERTKQTMEISEQNITLSKFNVLKEQILTIKQDISKYDQSSHALNKQLANANKMKKDLEQKLDNQRQEEVRNEENRISGNGERKTSLKRKINKEEIDKMRKNINEIHLEMEMQRAKQNDIKQRYEQLERLKNDKECQKKWILDSLKLSGNEEKTVQNQWIQKNYYKTTFLKSQIKKFFEINKEQNKDNEENDQ